jgi:hypothetical protein
VIGAFLPEMMLSDAAEFAINQRNEYLESLLIARSPFDEKLADGL